MDLFSFVSWSTGYASPLKSPYMILILASDHWVDMSLRVGFSSSLSLKFIHTAHGELVGNGEAISVTKCRPMQGILLIRSITAKNKRKSTVSPCPRVNCILAETHPIDSHMKYRRWQYTWAFEVHWFEACPKVIIDRHKSVSDYIAPNPNCKLFGATHESGFRNNWFGAFLSNFRSYYALKSISERLRGIIQKIWSHSVTGCLWAIYS